MALFKNQTVKHVTLGFTGAVLLWVIISVITVFSSSQPRALKNVTLDEFWGGVFTETWKIIDENKFIGSGCYIENGDTIFKEELSLIKIGESCGYTSTSDDNVPVLFTLTKKENRTWTFENKEHDFPNRIIYSLKADSSLSVSVDGKTFGILMSDEYQMKKAK
jgi:hypothetical protein